MAWNEKGLLVDWLAQLHYYRARVDQTMPEDGKLTRGLGGVSIHCRWCAGPTVAHKRGALACLRCDFGDYG